MLQTVKPLKSIIMFMEAAALSFSEQLLQTAHGDHSRMHSVDNSTQTFPVVSCGRCAGSSWRSDWGTFSACAVTIASWTVFLLCSRCCSSRSRQEVRIPPTPAGFGSDVETGIRNIYRVELTFLHKQPRRTAASWLFLYHYHTHRHRLPPLQRRYQCF